MKTEQKQTPVPWVMVRLLPDLINIRQGAEGNPIAGIGGACVTKGSEGEANVIAAVLAVNHHAELLAACENAEKLLKQLFARVKVGAETELCRDALAPLRNAIFNVKGGAS